MAARAYVGISGWRYAPWRGQFYPPGLVQRRELEFAAERFDSVEINGSFYSLQHPDSYRRWAAETPDGFVFAVKGGRYLTHMLRLRGVEAALGNFLGSGVLALGSRLGPILWQLPARAEFERDVLAGFLALLPATTGEATSLAGRWHDAKLRHEVVAAADPDIPLRHALEVRHASFAAPEALQLLRSAGVALVESDGAGRWPMLREQTADFRYIRLHGAEELYASGYTDQQLADWARDLSDWQRGPDGGDAYVYFDNDAKVHAPFDALTLRRMLDA